MKAWLALPILLVLVLFACGLSAPDAIRPCGKGKNATPCTPTPVATSSMVATSTVTSIPSSPVPTSTNIPTPTPLPGTVITNPIGNCLVVQSGSVEFSEAAPTTAPIKTLSAFGHADNRPYGALETGDSNPSAGSGFTVVHEEFQAFGRTLFTEWHANSNDNTVDWSQDSWFAMVLALEIKAAQAATSPIQFMTRRVG